MARLGPLLLLAALGLLASFVLLATAISSDYWFILEAVDPGDPMAGQLSSHVGLWHVCKGERDCTPLLDPFAGVNLDGPPSEWHLLSLRGSFSTALLLSLVLLACGWVWALLCSWARDGPLLLFAGCYFLLGGVLTLLGASIFTLSAHLAPERLAGHLGPGLGQAVRGGFGWGLGLAWGSCALELLSGALLLVAARVLGRSRSGRQAGPGSEVI